MKEINFKEVYKNTSEQAFAERMRAEGWEVTKRGYPDFICYRGNEVMFVEVKPNRFYRLKKCQHKLMNVLSGRGIRCYRWSPDKDWIRNGDRPTLASNPLPIRIRDDGPCPGYEL
jgi:hypothetical protein